MTDPRAERNAAASERRAGPLPGPAGRIAARVYGAGVARRNRKFDRGDGVITLDRPVISVGNLSVGGTGKTPMVAHLARVLLSAGRRPCIAMRGYGARPGRPSDEAAAYAEQLPDVPVVARPNRTAGLIDLFGTAEGAAIDSILLDDGFQHRQLARNLDLVLIDVTRSPLVDTLLPAGWLREPLTSLRRASGVVLTHAEAASPRAINDLRASVKAAGTRILAVTAHEWTGLDVESSSGAALMPVPWLAGKRVLAVCAIGNPGPFVRAVEKAVGRPLAGSIELRDHDPYEQRTIDRVLAEAQRGRADVIVTTAKDWTKLSMRPWSIPVARPRLALRFLEGEAELRAEVLRAASAAMDDAER